ncbi:MAG: hypothetical protein DHS20C20_22380 [Ardenticatenaceae bacterium]|nr:MAG: hypothetical protein DHS20C20_22380 [Ardenticatenaceae bacterium]
MLEPSGYAVKTLIQIKEGLEPNGEFSELMTASVDLIALKEGNSLVIDVMTRNETIEIPDWTTASEFRMAAMYLQGVLKLPPPIDAILILVDVEADESLHRFSEKHDIRVIQFSGQEVLELLKPDINETALQTTVATHFPRFESKAVNGKTSHQPILVNGGRNE